MVMAWEKIQGFTKASQVKFLKECIKKQYKSFKLPSIYNKLRLELGSSLSLAEKNTIQKLEDASKKLLSREKKRP